MTEPANPKAPVSESSVDAIFVIDDDPLVARTIANILRSVGLTAICFGSGQDFLDLADAADAGCILMDVRMPGISGIELLKRTRAAGNTLPVIVMTGHADVDVAVMAFRGGAFDFLKKPFSAADLIEVVQRALEMTLRDRASQARRHSAESLMAALGPREREVVPLLLAGLSNKEVGRRLGISHRTAEHHRQSILGKMGVRSVVELAARIGKPPLS